MPRADADDDAAAAGFGDRASGDSNTGWEYDECDGLRDDGRNCCCL